jgi:hypothetical protein
MEAEIVDLIGIYQLTGNGCGDGLPDVLMHVFRVHADGIEATVNSPGRICALAWYDPDALPHPTTATTRTAILDAVAGRSGVLRDVLRDKEPDIPEATDTPIPVQQGSLVLH